MSEGESQAAASVPRFSSSSPHNSAGKIEIHLLSFCIARLRSSASAALRFGSG
jgi:hypothetical protein